MNGRRDVPPGTENIINNSIIISTSRVGLCRDGRRSDAAAAAVTMGPRPDENINLHIIKAAAIKAIEIMQIIRKRRCRGNFCRHLKSFRRLSPMNIEQPRTCRLPTASNHSFQPSPPVPLSLIYCIHLLVMISSTNSYIINDPA